MKIDQKVIGRLSQLVDMGEQIKRTLIASSDLWKDGGQAFFQFRASSLSLLARTFGEESQYFKTFKPASGGIYEIISRDIGILHAAKDDYENGYLFNTRSLIEAEVFDDFLEQAQELLNKGYYQAAAVVTGCVLEDALRKLCAKHSVAIPDKATINPMNDALVKAGIYNVLVQKQVLAWADLRNKAAHGQWAEFTQEDVKNMRAAVRTFMAQHYV